MIPFSISNLVEKKELEIYGDGKNIRHWLSVKDTVSAVKFIIEKGEQNEIYNIGSDEYLTNNDVARYLIKIFELDESSIKYIEDRPGHDHRYAVNFDKIKSLAGHQIIILKIHYLRLLSGIKQTKHGGRKI